MYSVFTKTLQTDKRKYFAQKNEDECDACGIRSGTLSQPHTLPYRPWPQEASRHCRLIQQQVCWREAQPSSVASLPSRHYVIFEVIYCPVAVVKRKGNHGVYTSHLDTVWQSERKEKIVCPKHYSPNPFVSPDCYLLILICVWFLKFMSAVYSYGVHKKETFPMWNNANAWYTKGWINFSNGPPLQIPFLPVATKSSGFIV